MTVPTRASHQGEVYAHTKSATNDSFATFKVKHRTRRGRLQVALPISGRKAWLTVPKREYFKHADGSETRIQVLR